MITSIIVRLHHHLPPLKLPLLQLLRRRESEKVDPLCLLIEVDRHTRPRQGIKLQGVLLVLADLRVIITVAKKYYYN